MTSPKPITNNNAFGELLEQLRDEPVVALDTEFHRERTYFPKVALLQLAWRDQVAIVDPLAVDLEPFADILDSDATIVIHASSQDLEVLARSCGTTPRNLFDTQVAAGFLGMSNPSLASLVEAHFGVHLPKASRLTDWLQRPLSNAQLTYAASDVLYLIELREREIAELKSRGRLPWAEDEFQSLLNKVQVSRTPETAWRKIKEAKHLRGKARDIARSVAAWRERRAIESDQPARFVLPDLAVVAIAQKAPTTPSELANIRGLDERHRRGDYAIEITAAVREGQETPIEVTRRPVSNGEISKELRPAVALVSSWISQLAHDEGIDTAILATRSDLEALLRGDEDARLAFGWRAEMVGEPIRRLISGQASLAFGQNGRLALEERSGRPVLH